MAGFKILKNELTDLLSSKNISFRDWGDAVSIHFSDACDDLYYTESSTDSPAQIVEKFQMLDSVRSRILNALRHVAVRRNLFLEFDHSGTWWVGSKDGSSWSMKLGADLTKIIDKQGEIKAFRVKFKELYSLETTKGYFYSIISRLAKSIKSPISLKSTDEKIISYINAHSEPPKHEHTWEEFEDIEEERESIKFENDDGEEPDDFQELFNKFQRGGPQLLEPNEEQKNEIDQSSTTIIESFPEYPDVAEMLEECDILPETSMEARRRVEMDIEREWNELKNFYKKDRVVKLDDILEIMNKLSVDMIKLLMTEEQIHYIHRFCMDAVKEATIEDMQFSHEHILNTAWKMGWTEIAKTMRQRDDYTSLLFGFYMSASELEATDIRNTTELFDTYYFAKSLLIWSLFMPDEYTQRLIATALDVLKKGKGSDDDYLACAIAWQHCRA